MNNSKRNRQFFIAGLYAAVLISALFLIFCNLDGRLLWGDEAETAVLAKNVVKYGIPKTVDGANHITLYGGNIDGNKDDIWILSPWLQEYVAAAAFNILGPTTWAARAPFAFIGWLCLILFAFVIYRIYRDHWIALSGVLLLGTSEVFLLHARQCRYYSISVFGEILLIYALYQLLTQNKAGAITLALALVLQFYSNYIIALGNLPLLIPLTWILYRQNKRSVVWIVASLGVFFVVILPWLIYARPWQQFGALVDPTNPLAKVKYYLAEFHFHFLPWIFFLLPLAGLLKTRSFFKRDQSAPEDGLEKVAESAAPTDVTSRLERLLLMLLPLYLAMMVIPPGRNVRYLLPILPVACLLGAVWAFRHVRFRAMAVAVILVLCLSNGLSMVTGFPFKEQHWPRWPLIEYVGGITRPYTNRFADVVDFFDKEGRPGETVYVFDPEFALIFYTQLKIQDARLAGGRITEPLPDWILPESASTVVNENPVQLPDALKSRYETIVISVHDSPRRDGIPDPDTFEHRSTGSRSPFTIYRKRKAAAGD